MNSSKANSFKIIFFNVEGLSPAKSELLSSLCTAEDCNILCLQETHRDLTNPRPHIKSMKLIIELSHTKYGSAIFAKDDTVIRKATKEKILRY